MPESDSSIPASERTINSVATAKAPAFQFYPRDFMSDANVQCMNMEQRGVYLWLLCHAWLDGVLPNDTKRLAKMCQMPTRKFAALWPEIAVCFQEDGDVLTNPRMERERTAQAQRRQSQRINAALRWQSRGNANAGNPMAMPSQCSASASASASAIDTPKAPESLKAKRLTVEDVFGPSEPAEPVADDPVGRVVDLWTKEYADAHNGATFMLVGQKDYDVMRLLAKTYPDLDHLAKMLRFFFRANDLPDWAMLKTPAAFVRMASATDAAVRASR